MGKRAPSPAPDYLDNLLPSWELALRSDHKSPQTIKSYGDGVRSFIRWCRDSDRSPALDRDLVRAWAGDLLDGGAQPTTVRARQLGLRRFSTWLADEGEIDADPLLGLKPPKLDRKIVESLTDDDLKALLKACEGREFRDRRDMAIVRLMLESGMRAGEVTGITTADVDLRRGLVVVRRGKGAKGRIVPIGPQTATAIDRYQRARRTHRLAETSALWLGDRGKELNYYGLHKALKDRAARAGLVGFHPHKLRHTAASRWLAAGGSEGGLMAVAGWSSRDMIDRYAAATASERAADEARNLKLGEL